MKIDMFVRRISPPAVTVIYSYLNDSAGFVKASLTACMDTVSRAMAKAPRNASMNINRSIFILYSNDSSQSPIVIHATGIDISIHIAMLPQDSHSLTVWPEN